MFEYSLMIPWHMSSPYFSPYDVQAMTVPMTNALAHDSSAYDIFQRIMLQHMMPEHKFSPNDQLSIQMTWHAAFDAGSNDYYVVYEQTRHRLIDFILWTYQFNNIGSF